MVPVQVPDVRVRRLNDAPLRQQRQYVLYWMTATRRLRHNFALQRAAVLAHSLGRPLVVLEALRVAYPHASDRLHAFILEGMADNLRTASSLPLSYFPYVEDSPGAGSGLLAALAQGSCAVVTDDFPTFFLPGMVATAAERMDVRLESVDSNGLVPMRESGRLFKTAASFRRHMQKRAPHFLEAFPMDDPVGRSGLPRLTSLPDHITQRWSPARPAQLTRQRLSRLPIDHRVAAVELRGGSRAALSSLRRFTERIADYGVGRNHPDDDASSGLSPYLHFGHIGPHEIFTHLAQREGWEQDLLSDRRVGQREGFWGMSPALEAFVDQLVTWRELGFNGCAMRDDWHTYDALPDWALQTLSDHSSDPRPEQYEFSQLVAGRTRDPIWNAAQTQLHREGRMHNYLRMLWGKRLLEWCPTPRDAHRVMVALNDRFALDGRDPNSYSGIGWVLGRYDRAWGPERPIFGKIRYMSSANTRRKLKLAHYLARYGQASSAQLELA